ncbi:hypothetical protein ACQ4PT_047556 [Festuca glaucescens]
MVVAGGDYQDGCQRVALFFGTQIGNTEGFAKTLVEEAKARYDKAVFMVVDLVRTITAQRTRIEEYQEKLKKENIALLFLAMYGSAISSPPFTDYVQYYTCSAKETMHIYSS